MIPVINKDIFQAFVDGTIHVMVHQANCFHTMGRGIAKRIKYTFPEAFKADQLTKYGDISKLGTISYAHYSGDTHKFVVNLYGQHRYGHDKRYTEYDAVMQGLLNLRTQASEWQTEFNQELIIGIPYKMGCANAGGDWNVVSNIINSVFSTDVTDVKCLVFSPPD